MEKREGETKGEMMEGKGRERGRIVSNGWQRWQKYTHPSLK